MTRAASRSPASRLWRAKCSAVSDDEHAVSTCEDEQWHKVRQHRNKQTGRSKPSGNKDASNKKNAHPKY